MRSMQNLINFKTTYSDWMHVSIGSQHSKLLINIISHYSANQKLELLTNMSILISELELMDTSTPTPTSAPAPVTGSTSMPRTNL